MLVITVTTGKTYDTLSMNRRKVIRKTSDDHISCWEIQVLLLCFVLKMKI